jgi:hypothetical protein
MSDSKHSWTRDELRIVCICYKEDLPIELALKLTNTTNEKSMQMRYRNCLFLDKGRVEDSLSHASKTLVEVWEEVNSLYYQEESEDEFMPEESEQPIVQQQPIVDKRTETSMMEAVLFALFASYVITLISSILSK